MLSLDGGEYQAEEMKGDASNGSTNNKVAQTTQSKVNYLRKRRQQNQTEVSIVQSSGGGGERVQ